MSLTTSAQTISIVPIPPRITHKSLPSLATLTRSGRMVGPMKRIRVATRWRPHRRTPTVSRCPGRHRLVGGAVGQSALRVDTNVSLAIRCSEDERREPSRLRRRSGQAAGGSTRTTAAHGGAVRAVEDPVQRIIGHRHRRTQASLTPWSLIATTPLTTSTPSRVSRVFSTADRNDAAVRSTTPWSSAEIACTSTLAEGALGAQPRP